MKKIFLLLILLPLLTFSQDWEFIKIDGTYFYGNSMAYGIDSIIQSDSGQLLYSYRRVHTLVNDYEALLDPYTSWLGTQILIDNEEKTIFYNHSNQPFVMYSEYPLDVEWHAFDYSNGNYITARFASSKYWHEIFTNVFDSIIDIRFQVYNSSDEPVNHSINEKVIRLSKNYGMIDAFYYVGIDEPDNNFYTVQTLSGIEYEDEKLGIPYLFPNAVPSLEVNSCMHFKSFPADDYAKYIIRTVIDKYVNEEYCTYTYLDSILHRGIITTNTFSEKWNISALPYESLFPNDSINFQGYMAFYGVAYDNPEYGNTTFNYHYWRGQNDTYQGEYAWYVDYWELNQGDQYEYLFIENVGHLTTWKGYSTDGDELVYYKNSQQEWGEPLEMIPYSWDGSYPVFNPDFTLYFKKGPFWGPIRDVRAIRIDSIVNTEDLRIKNYYSYRTTETYKTDSDNFLNPYTSWVGDYAMVHDTGLTTIVNQYGEEYVFDSGSEFDSNYWIMNDLGGGEYILAYTSYERVEELLPGLSDTIKPLYFDYVGDNDEYAFIENYTLRWSKNYGLLDFIDFSNIENFKAYYLIGMQNDTTSYGWTNPTDDILTSLQINDESHIEYTDSLGRKKQLKRKVVFKEYDDVKVNYILDYCYQIDSDTALMGFYRDTLAFALNALPRQSIYNDEISGFKHSIGYGYFDTLEVCSEKAFFEFYRSNAIEEVDINGKPLWQTNSDSHFENQANLRFIESIGLSNQINFSNQEADTIYFYKTENEICGTAFEFNCETGLEELIDANFSIYPNPSTGIIYLQSSDNIKEVKVFNLNGQIVWQVNELKETQIDLSTLLEGLYLLELKTEEQEFIHQKLVIKK